MNHLHGDVLFECVKFLPGIDLLNCLEVCSIWNNHLKPCRIPHIWKPTVTHDLKNTILEKYSETNNVNLYPMLIALISYMGCQICGTARIRKIYLPFLIRCCADCFEQSTIADFRLKNVYKFDLSECAGLETFTKSTWSNYKGEGYYKVYWIRSIESRLGYTLHTRLINLKQQGIDRLLQHPLMIEATKNHPINQEVIESLTQWSHDENSHPYQKLAKEYILRAFDKRVKQLHEVLGVDELSQQSKAFWDALFQDPFEEKTLNHLRKLIKSREKQQVRREEARLKKKAEEEVLLEKENARRKQVEEEEQVLLEKERAGTKQAREEAQVFHEKERERRKQVEEDRKRCPVCPASSNRTFDTQGLAQHIRDKHFDSLTSDPQTTRQDLHGEISTREREEDESEISERIEEPDFKRRKLDHVNQ